MTAPLRPTDEQAAAIELFDPTIVAHLTAWEVEAIRARVTMPEVILNLLPRPYKGELINRMSFIRELLRRGEARVDAVEGVG